MFRIFRQYAVVLSAFIRGYRDYTRQELEGAVHTVKEIVQQSGYLPFTAVDQAASKVATELYEQITLVGNVEGGSDGWPILFAETNALRHNPGLEGWAFTDVPQFRLAVLPLWCWIATGRTVQWIACARRPFGW